jgi:hypothetical protein
METISKARKWVHCSIHNLDYPNMESCPLCDREKANKELNVWALSCLQSLTKAKRKDRMKLIQKYRKKICRKMRE